MENNSPQGWLGVKIIINLEVIVIMDITSVVSMTLDVLAYVLPAVFIWNIADVVVRAVVGAAIGRKRDGI